jgi:glutaredoxin
MTQVYSLPRTRRSALLALISGMAILGMAATGCAPAAEEAAAKSYEERLAEHLTAQEATMYGAFWCPHCADQKELFGEAVDDIQYVECDPEGENAQPQLCRDKNIAGYPTWEIGGELYPGTHSLEELAKLSGFEEQP